MNLLDKRENRLGSRRALVSMLAVLSFGLASCGGVIDDYGTYCLELSPSTFEFGCFEEQMTVQVTNTCGVPIAFGEPIVSDTCDGSIVVEGDEGTLEDGESLFFEVSYYPTDTGPWDCRVTFVHDYPTEPEPELPLSGDQDVCQ